MSTRKSAAKRRLNSAMILAAGRGERMRPLTDSVPKPLLAVDGIALIDRHLQRLGEAGIDNVVINTSWLGEAIQQHVGDGSQWNCKVTFSPETTALETAGGIVQALPLLTAGGDQEFLVINADVFCDDPVPQLLAMDLGDDLGRLLLSPTPDYLGGDFSLDGDRIVRRAQPEQEREQDDNKAKPPYIFCGLARYSVDLFAASKPGPQPMLPLLQKAIDAGQLAGETLDGRWLDVGTPERLEQASRLT